MIEEGLGCIGYHLRLGHVPDSPEVGEAVVDVDAVELHGWSEMVDRDQGAALGLGSHADDVFGGVFGFWNPEVPCGVDAMVVLGNVKVSEAIFEVVGVLRRLFVSSARRVAVLVRVREAGTTAARIGCGDVWVGERFGGCKALRKACAYRRNGRCNLALRSEPLGLGRIIGNDRGRYLWPDRRRRLRCSRRRRIGCLRRRSTLVGRGWGRQTIQSCAEGVLNLFFGIPESFELRLRRVCGLDCAGLVVADDLEDALVRHDVRADRGLRELSDEGSIAFRKFLFADAVAAASEHGQSHECETKGRAKAPDELTHFDDHSLIDLGDA